MDIEIKKQTPKLLLSREEFIATVEGKTTPSNILVKEEIAKKLGKSADLIVIKKIHQEYGRGECEIFFYVYSSIEALKNFEKVKVKKAAAQPAAGS